MFEMIRRIHDLDDVLASIVGDLQPARRQRYDRWYRRLVARPGFRGLPYMRFARYTSYYKAKKLASVVEAVRNYARAAGLQPGEVTVFDAGCRYGIYSVALASLGFKVIGVDVVNEAIDIARQWAHSEGLPIQLEVADAVDFLRDRTAPVNVVLALDVLEHMLDPQEFCMQVARALVPQGLFLAIVPNGYGMLDQFMEQTKPLRYWLTRHTPELGRGHVQKFSLRSLAETITSAGLEYKFMRSIYSAWGPFALLLLSGPRGSLAGLNVRLADRLPPALCSSWLVVGTRSRE